MTISKLAAGNIDKSTDFGSEASAGFGAGANLAFRFARYFLIGGMIAGGGLGGQNGGSGWSTYWLGPYLAYIGNPEGFGFYGELGAPIAE